MKKMIITLHDGTTIERDLSKEKGLPFGAPAHDQAYVQISHAICTIGLLDEAFTTDKKMRFISPTQIKHVDIILS